MGNLCVSIFSQKSSVCHIIHINRQTATNQKPGSFHSQEDFPTEQQVVFGFFPVPVDF